MTAAAAPVFVGVDGGGTTTRVLVVDSDGQPLIRVDGPASLVDSRHPRIAASVVARTTREALAEIGNPPVAALHAALAGAGRESVRSAVERALTEDGVARAVAVGTDVEAAFRDAFGSGPGVLLMAGTGSVAWGRSEEGSEARAGGWGGLMGDEGSGWSIGLAALRAVARASDGRGGRTALSGALEDRLGLSRPEELILWAGTASKGEVAGLTEPVVAAAGAGDAVARRILDEAVTALLSHVGALRERLGPWSVGAPVIALAGGLLAADGPLGGPVRRALEERGLTVRAEDPEGVRGAAALARSLETG